MRTRLCVVTMTMSACGGGGSGPPPTEVTGVVSNCDPVVSAVLRDEVTVSSEDELRDAALDGGSIRLTRDISASAPFEVGADAVIDGNGYTIDGQGTTHLFTANGVALTVQNITLRNGRNSLAEDQPANLRSGAAIRMIGGEPQAGSGSLRIIGTRIIDNAIADTGEGDLYGGAVYVENVPYTTIYDSEFTGNNGSTGGAVGSLGSSLSIVNSVFSGNQTNGTGAGASNEGHGGAISVTDVARNGTTASLKVCGSRFSSNAATNTGGAIYILSASQSSVRINITESSFEDNQTLSESEGQGGAVFIFDDEALVPAVAGAPNIAELTNSTFSGNSTFNRGGAVIYSSLSGELTTTNTTFFNNATRQSGGVGGALALAQGTAFITNATFSENFAEFNGGAIFIADPADAALTLRNTLFHNNTAAREGGLAQFHVNRLADWDGGGNMQFLAENLVIDESSDALVTPNALRADPLLLPLADNGGFAATMALDEGSPAMDAGVANGAPSLDERGETRVGLPDIGAFEITDSGVTQ